MSNFGYPIIDITLLQRATIYFVCGKLRSITFLVISDKYPALDIRLLPKSTESLFFLIDLPTSDIKLILYAKLWLYFLTFSFPIFSQIIRAFHIGSKVNIYLRICALSYTLLHRLGVPGLAYGGGRDGDGTKAIIYIF